MALRSCDQSRMRTQAAASRPATMPLLAFIRKDRSAESFGRTGPWIADLANSTGKRFYCGGIVAGGPVPISTGTGPYLFLTRFLHANRHPLRSKTLCPREFPGALTYSWSHALVIRPATALRGDP